MPLFEVQYVWTLSGIDTAVVEGKTPNEAKEKFQQKFGAEFSAHHSVPYADFLALEAIDTEPFQHSLPENQNDDYEVIL